MSTETVQTVVKDAISVVRSDAAVQKVVGDVLIGDFKDIGSDIKNVSVVTKVIDEVKADVTTHTVSFTCCCIPWSLQISHTPTASSQSKSAGSS